MRNLHELGVLHSVVDPSPQARQLAQELGVGHFPDAQPVFSDSAVQGVAIATPAQTHCEVALAAIAAGKDVYVEKPIALNLDDAHRMADAADRAGRILMVGHLLQYHPTFVELLRLVREGALGKVSYVSSSRLNFGRIRTTENVIWSFSPHDISMVLSLIGAKVARVTPSTHAILQDRIADIGRLEIEFENGAFAEIRASWLSPFKEQKLVVVGDRAMAVFDDREPWERKLAIHDHHVDWSSGSPVAVGGETRFVDIPQGEPLKMELQYFVDRMADRNSPRSDAQEAIAVLSVLQAAGPGVLQEADVVA